MQIPRNVGGGGGGGGVKLECCMSNKAQRVGSRGPYNSTILGIVQ